MPRSTPRSGGRAASPSIAPDEIARFSSHADAFWDAQGPYRMLHALGPVRVQYVLEQWGERPLHGARVLDVGSGGGLLAEELAARGARVLGIDPCAAAVAAAQKHAKEAGLSIAYRVGGIEDLADANGSYDLITAMEVVEHVADLESFLGATARLLKPGGVLVLSTLNRTKRSFLLGVVAAEYLLGWVAAGTHQWHRFRRPSELIAAMAPHGVHVDDVTGLAYHPLRGTFVLAPHRTAVNYFLCARKQGVHHQRTGQKGAAAPKRRRN